MTQPGSDGNVWGPPTAPPPPAGGPGPYGAPGQPYDGGPGQPYGPPGQPYGAPGQPYGAPGQPYGAPGQPYAAPGQPNFYGTPFGLPDGAPKRRRSSVATTGDVVAAVVAAAVMLLAGVPLGLLWGSTVPLVDVPDLIANSSETALEAAPAADARFAVIAAVFGLVAGLIAVWRGRRSGWPLPVGLLLGGLGGSLIAAQVGHLLASDDALAAVPPTANPIVRDLVDVGVRADGVHAVYPLVALLVFLILVALTTRPEPLTVPDEPPAGAWWSAPR